MTFIVATNVIASRPPEHRPTGTPHACAKITNKYDQNALKHVKMKDIKMTPHTPTLDILLGYKDTDHTFSPKGRCKKIPR